MKDVLLKLLAYPQPLRLALARNVKDNCATFFREYNPAPVGCMFHDLDFYSSTTEALTPF